MRLPALADWTTTAHGLHRAVQILAGVQMLLYAHDPHYGEVALKPVPEGIATGRLPDGGRITLDMRRAALIYCQADDTETQVPLAGASQAYSNRALLQALRETILAGTLSDAETSALVEKFTSAVRAKYPELPLHHTEYSNAEPLAIDPAVAREYAFALDTFFTGIARFRARVQGHWSRLVVFPEHFDMATIWYANPDYDENKPHIAVGFAPFSPGFERPYWYATMYPYPKDATFPVLPKPARWTHGTWHGVVIDYDALTGEDDPVLAIEQVTGEVFDILRNFLENS